MGRKTPLERNMTEKSQTSKILLLVLAGLGALIALGLIGSGLFLFVAAKSTATARLTPTVAGTPTPVPSTATVMAGVVIIPSPTAMDTAVPNETPGLQTADTMSRQPTATRMPTNTPTPIVPARRHPAGVTADGSIELIAPADNIQLASDTVEFSWKWLENKGCEQPPDGYAFEIRVWRDNDATPPMGAMDATGQKPNISCNPATGVRTFTIGRIKTVPGAEGQATGRLRWDVALVQLTPYQPVITTKYRTFFY